jgi:prolycopene isomerase
MNETQMNPHYDVIVIGSGASGLTCAVRLAQAGKRVLVVEQHGEAGGCTRAARQDGYTWDHGGHIFIGYDVGGPVREIFRDLGVDQHVEMVPIKHQYRCHFPDEDLLVPASVTEAADLFGERFPGERDGIEQLLVVLKRIASEVETLVPAFKLIKQPGERPPGTRVIEQLERPGVARLAGRLPGLSNFPGGTLLRYQTRTYSELLDEHLQDRRLKAYFAMLSAGIGTGPSELSAIVAAIFLARSLDVMWLPKGGFGVVAEALAAMAEKHGAELLTSTPVVKIIESRRRAVGVQISDGRRYFADAVVSAADAHRTLLQWIDPKNVPRRWRRRLPTMALTKSVMQIELGLDVDIARVTPGLERLNLVYPDDDLDRAVTGLSRGDMAETAFMIFAPTDPALAPAGRSTLKIEALTAREAEGIDWEGQKEDLADELISQAERYIPGLRRHIIKRTVRTPQDLEATTGSRGGAYAGWAYTPDLLADRPPQRTWLKGLYLCGQWTRPAAGVPWVILSGYNTAAMVLEDLSARSSRRFLRKLRGAGARRLRTALPEPELTVRRPRR